MTAACFGIAKRLAAGQLRRVHHPEVIGRSQTLQLYVARVACNNSIKIHLRDGLDDERKQSLAKFRKKPPGLGSIPPNLPTFNDFSCKSALNNTVFQHKPGNGLTTTLVYLIGQQRFILKIQELKLFILSLG
jgi:hypothetical protein